MQYLDLRNASRISDMTGEGKLSPIVTLSCRKCTTVLHFFLTDASVFLGITKLVNSKGWY